MPEEIAQLKVRLQTLESLLEVLIFSDRYYFQKDLQIQDGRRIQLGTANGTRIGTATTQLLSLWNATPVDQPAAVSAPATQGISYVQADVQSIVDRVNDIRSRLQEVVIIAT